MEKTDMTVHGGNPEGWTRTFLHRHFSKFIEINRKYATPRIKMTKPVRIALLVIRIYLILLVLVIGYKFLTIIGL